MRPRKYVSNRLLHSFIRGTVSCLPTSHVRFFCRCNGRAGGAATKRVTWYGCLPVCWSDESRFDRACALVKSMFIVEVLVHVAVYLFLRRMWRRKLLVFVANPEACLQPEKMWKEHLSIQAAMHNGIPIQPTKSECACKRTRTPSCSALCVCVRECS